MTHEFWHIIECGSVGTAGDRVSPGMWPKHSIGFVGYKGADEEIERILKPHAKRIARIIGRTTGGEVHDINDLGGGYYGVGIGEPEGPIEIPAIPQYSDAFITVIVVAPLIGEAEIAAMHAAITIERAEAYLKVYERTGGLIRLSYGIHGPE